MKAYLHNYRQSPRKVALMAGLVRGKSVAQALTSLKFTGTRSSFPVIKLIESAVANAKNSGFEPESLFIKEIRVDKGVTLKRMMPRAQGRSARINKRSSHVLVVLGDKSGKAPSHVEAKEAKVVAPKAAKAKAPKAEKKAPKAKK